MNDQPTDKTNAERLGELQFMVQGLGTQLAALSITPGNVYNRVQHYEGIALAITRVGIMASAVSCAIAFNRPDFLALFFLLAFTRQKRGPKQSTQEQLHNINARLDILMNAPPERTI